MVSRRFLRENDCLVIAACSKSQFRELVRRGVYPQPDKLGARFSVWIEDEFMAAHERRIAEARARKKPFKVNVRPNPEKTRETKRRKRAAEARALQAQHTE